MKYLIIIIVVLSMTIPSYGRSGADEDSVSLKADSLVNFAKTLVGTTYKWGGTTPQSGFDCSGFCRYVFTNSHVKVPRTSASYGNFGTQVQKSEARKGDVILFRGTDPKSTRIGHIGIVISNPGEPIMFIQCSSSKRHYGVVITDYENSHYPARFIKFMRVID